MFFYGLMFLLLIAPLHYGANRPLSWSFTALIAGILLLGWSIKEQKPAVPLKKIKPLVIPYSLVCLWIVIQCLPIGFAHPLWNMADEAIGTAHFSSISVAPYQTAEGLLRLLSYGAVFFLALQYGRDEKNARLFFKFLIFIVGGYALYGLIAHFYQFNKEYYQNSLTSTFINRNSYATYGAIGAVSAIGIFFRNMTADLYHLSSRQKLKIGIINILTSEIKYIILIIIISSSIILTHSRAGIASFVLGISVFSIMFYLRRKRINTLIFITGALILAVAFNSEKTIERFSDLDEAVKDRTAIYQVTLNAVKDMPFTGSGYNTFEQIFRLYKDETIHHFVLKRIDHAHNTYLENVLELGIPAFALLLFCFIYLFYTCLKGVLTRRKNIVYPSIGVAVTALVGFHSLFDFSLEMPAIAMTYSAIMGICCSQSWSTREQL